MGAVKVTDEINRVAGQLCFSPCIQTGQRTSRTVTDEMHKQAKDLHAITGFVNLRLSLL